MKSTLKRELKGLEIVEGEGNGCRCALWFYVKLTLCLSTHCAGQRGLDGQYNFDAACLTEVGGNARDAGGR